MNHNWSATKQRLHPQSVAEINRHSVLSVDRIRQCETLSGSRDKDTDQCLSAAISFCSRSDPVPCENGSAETTVAEGGRKLVAGCWLSWLTRPTYFWSSSEANSLIFHTQRFCLPFSSLITLNFAIITPHVLTTWWKYYYVIGWDIIQYKINGSSVSRLVLMLINRRLLLTNDLKQYSLQKHRTFEDMVRCTTLQTRKRRHKSR